MRRRLTGGAERGFTLVEVLVSMAVLAIALVGVAQMQVVAATGNASARELAQASQLAASVAEAVQSWDYQDTRLAPVQTFVGQLAAPRVVSDTTDTLTTPLQFALGNYPGASTLNVRQTSPSPLFPPASVDEKYRVYWSVGEEDANGDGVSEAKVVSIVVRWKHGTMWHNHNQVQARFNQQALRP